ncbi:MAG: EamA family transporter, partial [Candidatus Dadabacteria bacterium]|nr:EamA family transporter [Candidatus Dadabacteria bacterium]
WNRAKLGNDNPFIVNGYQLLFGAALLVVLAYAAEGSFEVEWNYHSVFIVLFTGIVASAINFSIWFYLINNFDINITTASSLFVPVVGLIFDRIILGTGLDMGVVFGGVLIVMSIYKISTAKL